MGTDVDAGGKRHQELNQPKFAEKWREPLQEQPAHPGRERAPWRATAAAEPRVLVSTTACPTPDRDAGHCACGTCSEAFVELGCRVTFLPDDLAGIRSRTRPGCRAWESRCSTAT